MHTREPYDQEYGTCSYTHVWLRIMSEAVDPDAVTKMLSVAPTETQLAGTPRSPKTEKLHKYSGWFLSTEGILSSKDARHHLDWILERVKGKNREFTMMRQQGYLIDICCRWDSKSGHGGPTLSPYQMQILAELDTELWFDIYFDYPEDEKFSEQGACTQPSVA